MDKKQYLKKFVNEKFDAATRHLGENSAIRNATEQRRIRLLDAIDTNPDTINKINVKYITISELIQLYQI